jgi:hypothetical protein
LIDTGDTVHSSANWLRPIAQYKKSQECPFYLTYILDHYNDLTEIIIFSHGRPQVHHANIVKHWPWFIQRVEQDTNRYFFNVSLGFWSANCGTYVARYPKRCPILDHLVTIEQLIHSLIKLKLCFWILFVAHNFLFIVLAS